MKNQKDDIEAFDINIKMLIRILFRHKVFIVLSLILFTLISALYAYFQPDIYSATTTVEVGYQENKRDMISEAMGSGTIDLDADMEIIQSRFLSQKAFEKVDFTHRYFTTKNFKEKELYKDSPFRVAFTKGYGLSFDLHPVDENSYRLVVAKNADGWSHDRIHRYEEEVGNELFSLKITRILENPFTESQYRFVVLDSASLVGSVSVMSKNYSPILHISYHDTVALRAQEYVNALAQAYIQQNIDRKIEEATLTITFIDQQLEAINENLQFSAEALEDFKKSTNTPDLSNKIQGVMSRMSEYELELSKTDIDEKMLATIYEQVKAGKNLETLSIAGLKLSDTALSGLIKDLQDAVMQRKILLQDYTEEYPAVAKLRNQIEQLKNIIINTIKSLKKNIQERKQLLNKLYLSQQKQLNTLPASEREYGRLYRKFAINEKIYSYLLEKRAETEILKASTISKNRILDSALLQNMPTQPKRKTIVLIGIVIGLLFGVIYTFLIEFFDNRIKDENDLKSGTQVPILGIIPHMDDVGIDDKIKVFDSPKSMISEAFRVLRTNLKFMSEETKAQVISVTSTVGGEGKSTICVNLGAIISLTGKKTIILNLDMRKPTLHKRFRLTNQEGMSNLLSNQSSLSDVIQRTEYENLDIVSSGPIPPNPSELIQGGKHMKECIEKLKDMYDVIIIDTPPIGLVTDAYTLMNFSDISIYVIRMNYSKKQFLDEIEKLFQKDKIRGLGILINDFKMSNSKYGYGDHYGYYEEDKK